MSTSSQNPKQPTESPRRRRGWGWLAVLVGLLIVVGIGAAFLGYNVGSQGVDYTDPEVPAAVADAERAARAASAPQREKEDPPPDPDRPSDEIWDGNTLTEP